MLSEQPARRLVRSTALKKLAGKLREKPNEKSVCKDKKRDERRERGETEREKTDLERKREVGRRSLSSRRRQSSHQSKL